MIEPGGRRQSRGLRTGSALEHLTAARQSLGQARRQLHALEQRDPAELISRLEDQVSALCDQLIRGWNAG